MEVVGLEESSTPSFRSAFTYRSAAAIFVFGISMFFMSFHRFALGVLGEGIAADFMLDDASLGTLGAAIFLTYGILQIPSGMAADRLPTRSLMIFSSLMTGISAIMLACASSFAGLWAARALVGAGTAFILIPATSYVRREFGDRIYGTVSGVMNFIGGLGNICATAPLRFFASRYHWTSVFTGLGFVSIFMVIPSYFLVRDTVPRAEKKAAAEGSWRGALKPGMLAVSLWFMLMSGTRTSFMSLWADRFFTRSLLLTPHESGVCLMMFSVGSLACTTISGRLMDIMNNFVILVGASIMLCVTYIALAMFPAGTPFPLVAATCLVNGIFGSAGIAYYGIIRLYVPSDAMGRAIGFNNSLSLMLGMVFTQTSGTIMELSGYAGEHDRFSFLLYLYTVITAATAALAWYLNRGSKGLPD